MHTISHAKQHAFPSGGLRRWITEVNSCIEASAILNSGTILFASCKIFRLESVAVLFFFFIFQSSQGIIPINHLVPWHFPSLSPSLHP
jgi:hypothetical protein